jgi:hypothetical protein
MIRLEVMASRFITPGSGYQVTFRDLALLKIYCIQGHEQAPHSKSFDIRADILPIPKGVLKLGGLSTSCPEQNRVPGNHPRGNTGNVV